MTALYIVDGDAGSVDECGMAETAEQAREIAEGCFADEIHHVERGSNITLSDGRVLSEAWVVVTVYGAA